MKTLRSLALPIASLSIALISSQGFGAQTIHRSVCYRVDDWRDQTTRARCQAAAEAINLLSNESILFSARCDSDNMGTKCPIGSIGTYVVNVRMTLLD